MKSIKMARGVVDKKPVYRVLVVKNSTRYNPGEELNKSEVDHLCENSSWDVTIVSLKKEKEEAE